eukprot:GHVS01053038.1.p1 GENE.GHVS01053038.1~~GHVS01053038.1.p1  ORF type:complete len:477 (-),score=49.91 GHVS01053038.1:473-1903(-)
MRTRSMQQRESGTDDSPSSPSRSSSSTSSSSSSTNNSIPTLLYGLVAICLIFGVLLINTSSSSFGSFVSNFLSCRSLGSEILDLVVQLAVVAHVVMLPGLFFETYSFTYGYGIMVTLIGYRCLSGMSFIASLSSSRSLFEKSAPSLSSWTDFSRWGCGGGAVFMPYFSNALSQSSRQTTAGGASERSAESFFSADSGGLWLWYGTLFQAVLFILYGVRICMYLLYRDTFSQSYIKYHPQRIEMSTMRIKTFFSRLLASTSMAWYSVLYFMNLYYLMVNLSQHVHNNYSSMHGTFTALKGGSSGSGWCCKYIIIVQILGQIMALKALICEQTSDCQKLCAKETASKGRTRSASKGGIMTTGLFKTCQQPNYFFELVYHVGMILGGVPGYGWSIWQWVIGMAGPVFMFPVIFSASDELVNIQQIKYKGDKQYNEYIKKTPVLWFSPWKFWGDILGFGNSSTAGKRQRTVGPTSAKKTS